MTAYQLTYYKPGIQQPVKITTVTDLALSTIGVKQDEWREWTGGQMTFEEVPPVFTDARGVAHSVSITTAYHSYRTGAGELHAGCICGWWDHHSYLPGGEEYARLKLQLRAIGHVSPPVPTPALSTRTGPATA